MFRRGGYSATDKPADWVNMTIEVDVRVKVARIYNTSFLG
jgi:hypothetical protein